MCYNGKIKVATSNTHNIVHKGHNNHTKIFNVIALIIMMNIAVQ